LWIDGERRAVRMVGCEEHSPGVVDQQEQLHADGPLYGVIEIGRAVVVRHNAGAVGVAVEYHPLPRAGLITRLELPQNVERHRHGLAEHDLTYVDGHALGCVHGLGEARCRRREAASALLAVAIELQMGEMKRQSLGSCDGCKRTVRTARDPEI